MGKKIFSPEYNLEAKTGGGGKMFYLEKSPLHYYNSTWFQYNKNKYMSFINFIKKTFNLSSTATL